MKNKEIEQKLKAENIDFNKSKKNNFKVQYISNTFGRVSSKIIISKNKIEAFVKWKKDNQTTKFKQKVSYSFKNEHELKTYIKRLTNKYILIDIFSKKTSY